MIHTLTLNPALDLCVETSGLKWNQVNHAHATHMIPGGKGLNVKHLLDLAGHPVKSYVFGDEAPRINVTLWDTRHEREAHFRDPGKRPKKPPSLTRVWQRIQRMKKPTYWALCGSLPLGTPKTFYRELIQRIQGAGVSCLLDTSGPGLKAALKARPFVVKPNQHEFEALVGTRLQNDGQRVRYARRLLDEGPRLLILSLGARGALFVPRDRTALHIQSLRKTNLPATGAGDALAAGFLMGLDQGLDWQDAALQGVAASFAWVSCALRFKTCKLNLRSRTKHLRIRAIREHS